MITGMFRGKVVGAALCGRPKETAGAGALSAKHEEMPLGYPRSTVIWLLLRTVRTVPYGGAKRQKIYTMSLFGNMF